MPTQQQQEQQHRSPAEMLADTLSRTQFMLDVWETRLVERILERRRNGTCDTGEWVVGWATVMWGLFTVSGVVFAADAAHAPTVLTNTLARSNAPDWLWHVVGVLGVGMFLSGLVQLSAHYFGPDTLRHRMARIHALMFFVLGWTTLLVSYQIYVVGIHFLFCAANMKVWSAMKKRSSKDAAATATDFTDAPAGSANPAKPARS